MNSKLPPIKFEWRGIHHGYLGIFFVVFGVFFLFMNAGNNLNWANIIYVSFLFSGTYLIIDDAWEHLVTANTPLRNLWNWMISKKSWW